MNLLMVLFVANGILLILISLPLYLELIGPNLWYGFRMRKTLQDRDIWYKVNKHGALRLMLVGLLTVIFALGYALIPNIATDGYAILCGVTFVGMLAFALSLTTRYMNSL